MARTLKTKGMEEATSLERRINRQHKLGRIGHKDWRSLINDIRNIQATIVGMTELNEQGEEEGVGEW